MKELVFEKIRFIFGGGYLCAICYCTNDPNGSAKNKNLVLWGKNELKKNCRSDCEDLGYKYFVCRGENNGDGL